MAGSYSTTQIARSAGVTYRQLDYWCRVGLIEPSIADANGQGTRRRWSADDLAQVRRIARASRIQSGRLLDAIDAIDALTHTVAQP